MANSLVTLHVYDNIRTALGRGEFALELPEGATIGKLFAVLAKDVDSRFQQLSDDDSASFAVALIVLDGERICLPRDADRLVADGAQVHLIPPISGG